MDMLAARLYGKDDLRVERIPVPEIADDEILVKVKAAAVCGTDLRMLKNGQSGVDAEHPVVLAHEFAGLIDRVGSRITGYAPGQRVSVRLRGLASGWRDGAMQIGLPPEPGNRFATGYFYHRAMIRQWVTAERDVEPVEPLEVSADELSRELCGRLVRISGLEADREAVGLLNGVTWASVLPSPQAGYVDFRPVRDPAADPVTVVTSGYASFALAPVPRSEVTLTGILFYGRGGSSRDHFLLKLRDENDIAF